MSGERDRLFGRILDLIEKKKDTGRILDIGAGCGGFMAAAQKRGWKVKKVSKKLSIERSITRFLVFHEYCFTPGFVRRLLSDNGFADIEVYNSSLSGGSLIHRFRRLPQYHLAGATGQARITPRLAAG